LNQGIKIFLFLWFYAGWFGCIFLAQKNMSAPSFLFSLVSFGVGYLGRLLSFRNLLYLILVALLGFAVDGLFYVFNVISFPNYNLVYPPVWLLALWFLFVSVLPLMETFFHNRLLLSSILAAIFGPLSYYAGASFQVLYFTSHISFIAYILFWGISFPVMIYFQRKFK